MGPFTRRSMIESDRSFIARSWVESHKTAAMSRVVSLDGSLGQPDRAWTPSRDYWDTWNGLVNCLLDAARTTVLLDDTNLIAGFICWHPWEGGAALHYLYVRLMHRGIGLARVLADVLPDGDVVYTHRSRGITKVPNGWRYSLRPIFDLLREAA